MTEWHDLSGHVALVTGRNSGIGLGMARGLHKAGAAVAIWGTNEAHNDAAVIELSADGSDAAVAAFRVDVSDEDAFIMSLAENIARRQCRPLELLSGIEQLKEKGYTTKAIASKTGLTHTYVQGILTMLQQGEQRLIVAVERGEIPLNAAIAIVGAKGHAFVAEGATGSSSLTWVF